MHLIATAILLQAFTQPNSYLQVRHLVLSSHNLWRFMQGCISNSLFFLSSCTERGRQGLKKPFIIGCC